MWDSLRLEEFRVYIDDLIQHPNVQMMNQIKQHINGVSCLDHCIFVSYVSFSICKKLKLNAKAAARAGLLHDLYLCDWSQTNIGPWKRLLIHPQIALRNAEIHGLSDLEKEVEKLDELGLSEMLEIAQARYDRYLANLPS